jgi:hypothetical protein
MDALGRGLGADNDICGWVDSTGDKVDPRSHRHHNPSDDLFDHEYMTVVNAAAMIVCWPGLSDDVCDLRKGEISDSHLEEC